jgi:hypothetical protein
MSDLKPTWKHALIVAWAISWRQFAIVIPVAFLGGIVISTVVLSFGASAENTRFILLVCNTMFGLYVFVALVKWALSRSYGRFKVTLTTDDQHDEPFA